MQGYIQGLEQGSIQQDCTFITIKATPTTFSWENGKATLTRKITFKDLDGYYHTTVTKIKDNIYGTGPKKIKVDVYEPSTIEFDIDGEKWLGVVLTVPGVLTYFAWMADAHTILAVFNVGDLTLIKLEWATVHNNVYGMVKAVGVPVGKILAMWAPLPALPLFCLQVGLAAFLVGDLAYAISAAAGLSGWACWGNAIGGAFIGAGISLLTANIGGLAVMVGITSVATLAACLIGVGVIIILVVVIWWWVTR